MTSDIVHVLISEGENVTVVGAWRLFSDAAREREVYIDEVWARNDADKYEVSNRYGDIPATALDIMVGGEVAETLTIQAVAYS